MGKRKLTQQDVDNLREAYEQWSPYDPESPSADELAAQFGVTKQTLYNLRRQWKAEALAEEQAAAKQREQDLMRTVEFLAGELARARAQIDLLREQLGQ